MEQKTVVPAIAKQGILLGILTLAAQLLLTGCNSTTDPTQAVGPPPKVKIAQPKAQEVTEWDEFTGHIEAVNSVDIRARVSGYLDKVNFKAGDKVKKGELLFLIDPKPYQAQLNYAKAELDRAKSRRDLAKNDLDRADHLFQAKAISAEEHDARSKGYQEVLAAVKSAEASVDTARLNIEFTEIRSPIDGKASQELITAGNLINGAGSDATLLTTVVSTDPVYVYLAADERSVLKYRRQAQQLHHHDDLKGTPVQLALADEDNFPHQGQIDYVAPREDLATGTITLRAVFSNPNGMLSPGFFARIRVRGNTPYSGLLVPERAIGTDQDQRFVWVVNKDNQVQKRKVLLGAHIEESRVIKEGLQADEWLVIEGLQKLRPDSKIAPERIANVDNEQEK